MSQPFVGEIRMFAGNFAIAGWAFCNGALLPISENETLFQLIGTTYGGDGQSTFALPNLQSRVPMHQGSGFTLAETSGTETVTLTVSQIPAHSHPMLANSQAAASNSPGGGLTAQTGNVNIYSTDVSITVNMNAAAISAAGGSQPHDNTQPFLVINFIISLFGVFPSQT